MIDGASLFIGLLLGAAIALGVVAWLEHRAAIRRMKLKRRLAEGPPWTPWRVADAMPDRVPQRPWPRGRNPPPTFAKPESCPPSPPPTSRLSGKGHSESVGVGRAPSIDPDLERKGDAASVRAGFKASPRA